VVRVSPARKPPPLRFISDTARPALDTPGAADQSFDAEDSDEALVRPPAGCSSIQRRIGTWLQNKTRCPGTLIAIFYLLKLRTWISSVVRRLLLLSMSSRASVRHPYKVTISILSRQLYGPEPGNALVTLRDGVASCMTTRKGTSRFLSICI
jgi:hypothetical protein